MNWDEERLLYKVAKMYYEEDLTQNQIAQELGIYRTTIGRMLKKAREKGIVHIEIRSLSNNQFEIEDKIAQYFGLKEVIVIPSNGDQSTQDINSKIGNVCSQLFNRILKDDDVVGLAWGSTLGNMVNQLSDLSPKQIDCVPLVGSSGEMDVEFHVNAMVYKLAQSLSGHAHFIDAAAIYKSKETTEEILSTGYMQKILKLWEEVDIAIVGIGAKISSSNMVWSGFLGDKEQEQLHEHHAIGDICSRFYTISGQPINSEISERTVAIPLEKLATLRCSIGIAYSVDKVESILGAIQGKFINYLITDEETALELSKYILEK